MELTDDHKERLGTVLNEASVLGIELDAARRTVAVTFGVLALPEPADARVQFVLAPVGRVAASLRKGNWNDAAAEVVPFAPEQLLEVVRSFGGQPVYGWEFFDVHEPDFPTWSDRLSLDWRSGDDRGHQHTLRLFQEGNGQHLDVCIWFDEFEVRDAGGEPVSVDTLHEGSRRFWAGVQAGDPRTTTHGIVAAGEANGGAGDDQETPEKGQEEWTRRDIRIGALFLVTGIGVLTYAYLAMQNGIPTLLWGTGWVLGPAMLLLGANALWRSLRATR